MKTKTKKRKKKSSRRSPNRKAKEKHYSVGYLVMIVIVFLLLEILALGSSTIIDWKTGTKLLDVSEQFEQTVEDFSVIFEPPVVALEAVFGFYKSATNETMILLDASKINIDPMLVVRGVDKFYQLATFEMSNILDFSESSQWPARVAGVHISN
jgi:hypothetical protein